jgi:hypothetical protein
MLMFYAEEEKNPWEAVSINPAPAVLSLFEDNPYGSFEEMFFEQTLCWEPYNRQKLLDYLSQDNHAGIDVRGWQPLYREGSLSRHPTANGIMLRVNPGYVASPGDLARGLRYLERWQKVLPRFFRGKATSDRRPSEFFLNQGLDPLPPCFGAYLGWYTLLEPRGYAQYFEPEDLRSTPAHRVEEHSDTTFAITAYPDPFDFESTEARHRIVEITRYLNERRKDRAASSG